jgi:hypothetical protein
MEKKYRIRKLDWKRQEFLSGYGFCADFNDYFLRVRIICDGSGNGLWFITHRTTPIDKGWSVNIESAKIACEAAWVAFLEKEFLEVAE